MMKAPSDDHDEVVEINVVPMLDLAWNLLVVFMIVVTASVQGITVNLPKASAAVSKIKPTTKAITVTADGTIFPRQFSGNHAGAGIAASPVQGVRPQPAGYRTG